MTTPRVYTYEELLAAQIYPKAHCHSLILLSDHKEVVATLTSKLKTATEALELADKLYADDRSRTAIIREALASIKEA